MKINDKLYRELRCNKCRKLICYEYIYAGRIAFNCPRCGELSEVELKYLKTTDNMKVMDNDYSINNLQTRKVVNK